MKHKAYYDHDDEDFLPKNYYEKQKSRNRDKKIRKEIKSKYHEYDGD